MTKLPGLGARSCAFDQASEISTRSDGKHVNTGQKARVGSLWSSRTMNKARRLHQPQAQVAELGARSGYIGCRALRHLESGVTIQLPKANHEHAQSFTLRFMVNMNLTMIAFDH
jgi:hypothetical protein